MPDRAISEAQFGALLLLLLLLPLLFIPLLARE